MTNPSYLTFNEIHLNTLSLQKHGKSSGMPGSPVDISRHSSRDTSGGFKIFKNKAEKNVTSKEKTSSGGLFGWMGITDSRPKPSEAFLGEKNRWRCCLGIRKHKEKRESPLCSNIHS